MAPPLPEQQQLLPVDNKDEDEEENEDKENEDKDNDDGDETNENAITEQPTSGNDPSNPPNHTNRRRPRRARPSRSPPSSVATSPNNQRRPVHSVTEQPEDSSTGIGNTSDGIRQNNIFIKHFFLC